MNIRIIDANEWLLVVDLFDQYRVFYKQLSDKILAEKYIRERLGNNESVIFIAEVNNQPVGFTQLYPKYSSMRAVKNWILNDLFVAPAYRQKGIGQALINAVMNFAKQQNAGFVQLETRVDNYIAQRLYDGIGFIKQLPDAEFLVYRKNVE